MSLDQKFHINIHDKLGDVDFLRDCSWGKVVSYLKRQFDQWATEKLAAHGHKNFKMAFMPVLMNIEPEGTNNNDLAKHGRVTKQAMSKVAKELHALGYIKTRVDANDKRSTIFILTDRGKKLVVDARTSVRELMNEYRQVIGHAEFDNTLDVLVKIIAYTDHKNNTDNG
jgi:DNA-binding MarR family transcriptional regulator